MPVKTQLFIYDFDWSLADQDSDRWVLEVLEPTIRRKMEDLEDSWQWTDLVAQSMIELHAKGFTRKQVEDALRAMPFHPAMVRAVRDTRARTEPESTFFCLSNANEVYISIILEHHGITGLFKEVVTNPATWSSDLLVVRRRIPPDGPQHSCSVGCSPNMCKGEELDAFLARHGTFDRMTYIGDGSNDFCPILRLRPQDLALVRRGRGLESRIAKEGRSAGLVCQVQYWAGAWEVEEILAKLT